ncbi:DNA translocase FtsK [Castellaniella sp.]|uniref:DNA translocase FtsK n=1 Tax=Castellaniella sp. TaxID=1955812 RepID=UPI002AFF9883|nr:DNA translocase FtsK [Castellaniella sp.]
MLSTDEDTPESTDYYGRAREVALAYGWVTVSLIQRQLRLGYGFALSLVDGLEHRGVVGTIDATGRRLVLFDAEDDIARAVAASDSTIASAQKTKLSLSITPQSPLSYRLSRDKIEHSIALTPSLRRRDDFYCELCAEQQIFEKIILTRYFSGESRHGTFEILVECLRPSLKACFEVETVTVVVQPENVRIAQFPTFTVVQNGAEDFHDCTLRGFSASNWQQK